jgi:hypothetical protein
MLNKTLVTIGLILVLGGLFSSCQSVKPYQRMYLNDSAMQFGQKNAAGFEINAHAIREGSSSGQTKSSGGCGCN